MNRDIDILYVCVYLAHAYVFKYLLQEKIALHNLIVLYIFVPDYMTIKNYNDRVISLLLDKLILSQLQTVSHDSIFQRNIIHDSMSSTEYRIVDGMQEFKIVILAIMKSVKVTIPFVKRHLQHHSDHLHNLMIRKSLS